MMRSRRTFLSPIPGAGIPPRGLFIDRWGTLLETPRYGVVRTLAEVTFTPGALDALFHARQSGWEIYLVGNEPDVAFGKLSMDEWRKFEAELLEHLRSQGIPIKRSYACLDHPRGVKARARDSVFLLPNTGALYHASQFDGISLPHSWVIGDGNIELAAGWRAGCRIAGVGRDRNFMHGVPAVDPVLVEASLANVLEELRVLEPVSGR